MNPRSLPRRPLLRAAGALLAVPALALPAG